MKRFALLLALVFSLSLVYGLVPTIDSHSVSGSTVVGVDFNVNFVASGTSLTTVQLYNLDTRTLLDSRACSGSTCSGTFTLNFGTVGVRNLFLVVRASDGSRYTDSPFAVDVTSVPIYQYFCDSDFDGQIGMEIDGNCTGVGCVPALCSVSSGLDCDDSRADTYYGAAELCDSYDNDCDGSQDEDFYNLGSACFVGVGACTNSGFYVCALSKLDVTCSASPLSPTAEICDNIDNDCNSFIDDGLSRLYSNQVGVCSGSTESCSLGSWVLDSIANYEAVESSCDSLDNDCDGTTDENSDASCNDGLYCNGVETCSSGSCSAGVAVDCSSNDLSAIGQCDYDAFPLTWDFFAGFTSTCNEVLDSCTTSVVNVVSSCSIASCGASCESSSDCPLTDCSASNYCLSSSILRSYNSVSDVCSNCSCVSGTCSSYTDVNAPLNSNQNGVCSGSYQRCSSATFVDYYLDIVGYELTESTKDHLDNDCDGLVDEGLNNAPTFVGDTFYTFNQYSYLLIDLDTQFEDIDLDDLSYTGYTEYAINFSISGSIANVSSKLYGNFSIDFTADDGFGGNVTQDVYFFVNRTNLDVPVINSCYLNESVVYANTKFKVICDVTDSDPISLESELFVNGVSVLNGSDVFSGLWSKDDNVTLKVTACDWSYCSTEYSLNFTVADALPVLTILGFSSLSSPSGDDPVYYCNFSVTADPDGEWYTPVVQFLWNDNEEYNTYFDGNITTSYNIDKLFSYNYNISERLGYSVVEVGTVVGCNVTLYQGSLTVSDTSNVTIVNDVPELVSLSLLRDYSSRGNDLVYYTSSNATFDLTRTVNIVDYLGADYYVWYSTNENDVMHVGSSWWAQQTSIDVTLWNGTVLHSSNFYAKPEIVFPSEVGNYTFTVEVFDELGASTGIVTVNVDLRNYAVELPTLICEDMNISDGWENVGAFACTCSNNYLGYLYTNENRTIKLSNIGDYLNSFNMSVDLLSVYDYDLALLSESNPFDKVSSNVYQWFPLWANTNKTYTFNVTCTNEVGSVNREVVVDVAEGDYDFVDSFFVGVDVTNVTGNGLNETLATVPTDVNATEWVFGYNDVLLMQKFLGTNDLSLIVPINNLWENVTDTNGHVGGLNSENRFDRLSYNMTQMMQYYRSLDMNEKYFLNSFEPDWTPIACSIDEYNQGICVDGYTTAYSVKVIKVK
ncbi:putative metal-binding motif-containing protein [Candidatus Woesearchaeota archaeon]|nr:putative metal-binding motif-containing protein [Candidatus Woesearchaeota archaeon]